mgnify:CR=1 FL=1
MRLCKAAMVGICLVAGASPAFACRYPAEGSNAYNRLETDRATNRRSSYWVVRGIWHRSDDADARELEYDAALQGKEISADMTAAWSFGSIEVTEVLRGPEFHDASVWYWRNLPGICRNFRPEEGLRGTFYLTRSNPASMDSPTIVDFEPEI